MKRLPHAAPKSAPHPSVEVRHTHAHTEYEAHFTSASFETSSRAPEKPNEFFLRSETSRTFVAKVALQKESGPRSFHKVIHLLIAQIMEYLSVGRRRVGKLTNCKYATVAYRNMLPSPGQENFRMPLPPIPNVRKVRTDAVPFVVVDFEAI
jgi:hypothetical protein